MKQQLDYHKINELMLHPAKNSMTYSKTYLEAKQSCLRNEITLLCLCFHQTFVYTLSGVGTRGVFVPRKSIKGRFTQTKLQIERVESVNPAVSNKFTTLLPTTLHT